MKATQVLRRSQWVVAPFMRAAGDEVKPDAVRVTRSGLARAGVGRNMSTRGAVLNTMIYDLAHTDGVD
jgi:hypothetical protein